MKNAVAACLLLIATPSIVHAAGAGPQDLGARRPLQIEDRYALRAVGMGFISPDGQHVAYTVTTTSLAENSSSTRLWMVETAGGEPIPMTAESGSVGSPRWSPDGRYLSFTAARNGGRTQVWALDRRGGEARQITESEHGVSGYAWSPDARRLVLRIRDPKDATPSDAGSESDDSEDTDGSDSEPAPEVDGPWVIDRLQFKQDYQGYLDRRRTHLYVFDLESKELTQITSGDYDDSQPQWSPDGSNIAFVSNRTEEPDANYNTDIWLVDPDNDDRGGSLVQVTTGPGGDSSPQWFADSERLAFITHTQPELWDYDQSELAVVRIGEAPRVLTETLDQWVRQPRISADGTSVYFLLQERGSSHVGMIPAAGGELSRPVAGQRSVSGIEIGPDGTLVMPVSHPHQPRELFALDPGARPETATDGGSAAGSDLGDLRRLTHVNDAIMAKLELAGVEKVLATSADGTEIETFIFKPPTFDPASAYPTVLWIHGGPQSQFEWGFNFMGQWLAANGYVAVLPNPRGSTGYGLEFELGIWKDWGNVDRDDVLAAVDKAIELGYADPDRLAVGGWSYGGILTNYVITSTERFKAAMSGASGALWVANYGHDQYQRWYENELGLPWENRELWERLSPFNRVDRITTPTMWMGGERDWNVPIQGSEMMYQAMRRLGRETVLVVYPNQYHGIDLPTYDKDYYQRVVAWYDKHLKPQ